LFVHALFLLVGFPEAAFGEIELHGEMMVPLVDEDHPAGMRACPCGHKGAGGDGGFQAQLVSDFHRSPSIQARKRMNHDVAVKTPIRAKMYVLIFTSLHAQIGLFRHQSVTKPYLRR